MVSDYGKLTDVSNIKDVFIIDDGLVSGAQLDGVKCPDGGVIFIKEALVWTLGAVVRTLAPLIWRGVGVSEDIFRIGLEMRAAPTLFSV